MSAKLIFAAMIGAIISVLLTLLGVGGAVVWYYDRRPEGAPPPITIDLVVFHPQIAWPESLKARADRLDAALTALQAAEAAAGREDTALKARDLALGAEAARADAKAQAAIAAGARTLIRRIPVYVSATDDHRYPLSWGWVRVHDAAALGAGASPADIPIPADQSDDAAASIAPSDAVAVIAANYAACHADARQLSDLQTLWRSTKAAWDGESAPSAPSSPKP